MRKQILSVILVLCMLCALLPVGVPAAQAYSGTDIAYPVEGGNIYFDKETGTITDCDDTVISADIPAQIDDVAVMSIGDWAFSGCGSLTSAVIPDGVTGIGDSAFIWCSSLTSVTIPNSVTSIGSSAFALCSRLISVTIPNSVTSIGSSAFSGCNSLTAINVEEENASYASEDGVLFDKDKTILYIYPNCKTETDYVIPSSVTIIADGAFFDCTGLTSVTIPSSVTSIGSQAFRYCFGLTGVNITDLAAWCQISFSDYHSNPLNYAQNLYINDELAKNITLPEGLTRIGDSVLSNCTSLTSVTIPSSVTSISDGAFDGCRSLTEINVAEENTVYASEKGVLFDKDKSTLLIYPEAKAGEYVIPNSVTSIRNGAFSDCSSLTSVMIPNSVKSIDDHVFSHCSSLTSVTIPNSVTSIGEGAFYYCSSLTGVTLPDSVTSIGEDAFAGCSSLTSVTIPDGVTSIANSAFSGCSSLSSVMIPDSVTSIGWLAFFHCSSLTSVTIPNRVTSIGYASFSGCSSLAAVTIPNSLTSIDHSMFANCSGLTSVTIPESVTSIDDWAFNGCNALSAAYFLGNAPELGIEVFQTVASETYESVNISGLVLYYLEGKTGWTTPTWNGYPTAIHEHTYTNTVIVPTCTEKGEEKGTCSRCGVTETREIAATGHTEVIDAAIAATCTEAGKTEGKHCSVCNAVLAAQEEIPALGHQYENGVCVRCGEKDPQSLPPVEFADVAKSAWYVGAVEYAVQNGLMNGVGNEQFAPEGSMTRAMLVTVLWRFEGEPMEGTNRFRDVPNGQWYTNAVAWAASNGVVNGVGDGKFAPEGKITREQMATILYRYAEKKGIDTSKRGDLGGFPDANQVSGYAKDAVQWAVGEGIINGSDGKLLPQGSATRAQVATILMRYIENIVKR